MQNFTEIVSAEPLRRGIKPKRGSKSYTTQLRYIYVTFGYFISGSVSCSLFVVECLLLTDSCVYLMTPLSCLTVITINIVLSRNEVSSIRTVYIFATTFPMSTVLSPIIFLLKRNIDKVSTILFA